MRLLNSATLAFHEVHGDCHEPYAILSHTWGDEECSIRDMALPDVSTRKGYPKIKMCCDQAAADGLKWAWVDTCCIDKTSTAELSEAINSMFRWYRQATVCYAYIADVDDVTELPKSRWFTRGWTLQELIAPSHVQFYSSAWKYLGAKHDQPINDILHNVTGIEKSVLRDGEYRSVCAARRMAWAAKRETTRIEDRAYALMGLFDVNMPLIYGEGTKSFLRLQQEILKDSEDLTILCWGIGNSLYIDNQDPAIYHAGTGPFAKGPSDFATHMNIRQAGLTKFRSDFPVTITGAGTTLKGALYKPFLGDILVLPCTTLEYPDALIGIPVTHFSDDASGYFSRRGRPVRMYLEDSSASDMLQTLHIRPPKVLAVGASKAVPKFFFGRIQDASCSSALAFDAAYHPADVTYDAVERSFAYPDGVSGIVGALIFSPNPVWDAVQSRITRLGHTKLSSIAILFGIDNVMPWFSVVRIQPQSTSYTRTPDSMTREQVRRCVLEGKVQPGTITQVFGLDEAREYCLSKVEHYPGIRLQKEELKILLGVRLRRSEINYVDQGYLLSIDIAGCQKRLGVKKPDIVYEVKGHRQGTISRPDWQAITGIGGQFIPVLSELVPNPRAARSKKAWCREEYCLVCHFGSPEGHSGFP
ncbi:heterokaryon incompatibility protein (HET) domain-containing protein [Sarocladium implicatum]|nr:heterokaryon incompatibility protein (HET) domain-containing protein [Sarocladium implicatum]